MLKGDELIYIQRDLGSGLQLEADDNFAVTIRGERLAGAGQRAGVGEMVSDLSNLAIILGYLDGEPLARYMNDVSTVEVTNEGELVRINATGKLGSLQAWLDPEFGHLPRRLSLIKKGADLYNGRRVDEIDMRGGNIWPPGGVQRIDYAADDIALARSDDLPYIRHAVLTKKFFCEAGPVVTFETDATVTEIAFKPDLPDSAFRTEIEVPIGHAVTVEGAAHLPYVWDGNWAAPDVEPVIELKPRPRQGSGWRQLLVYGNLLAFVCLVGFVLFRRWRAGWS